MTIGNSLKKAIHLYFLTDKGFPSKSANYRIIHPHFDNYDEHIEVAVPGATYRYITEKGRHTIEVCELLRYHQTVGRKKVDLGLQAVLLAAENNQIPEMLQYAMEEIARRQAAFQLFALLRIPSL
ncbi:hypothetical protein [Vibrio tetraodonis]|uniref:hypothetical protein n=1 Tax=Vibrio tetraodonis TaxID=2231647 RepID=UPI001F0715BD|nr:hypothetical protein [Vibrio tetraodonis]